jgi:putative membrane protein
MIRFLLRWAINAVAIFLAILLVPGISFSGGWVGIIWLALIFGLVNAFLRPLLRLLTCPLIILTLGLFTLLINTFLFWLTGQIAHLFGIQIAIHGFLPAFLGGLVVSIVSILLSLLLKDELKGKHRAARP